MVERTTELRNEIEDTRDRLGDTLDAIGDRVSPGRIVERRKNRALESIDQVRHRVMGAAPSRPDSGGVRESASHAASAVGDAVRSTPDMMSSGAEGNPLIAGGLAFGLGLLVATLLPPTETETSVAQDVVEPLKQEAADIGKHVGDAVKSSSEEAGEQVKSAVTEAASTVKEEASSKAQDVKQTAAQAADEVKTTAQESKDELSDRS